jgi:hypothetical protein
MSVQQAAALARLTDADKQVLRDIIQRSVGRAPCAAADFPADSIERLVEASCVSVFRGVVVARGAKA